MMNLEDIQEYVVEDLMWLFVPFLQLKMGLHHRFQRYAVEVERVETIQKDING